MITCKDLKIELCIHCKDQDYLRCWSNAYVVDDRIKNQSDQDIIKFFIKTYQFAIHSNFYTYKDMYWYREIIRIHRPHLIEKLDKLILLI